MKKLWFVAVVMLLSTSLRTEEKRWQLEFSYRHPRRVVLDLPMEGLTYYWYILYTVKNNTDRTVPLNVRLWIVTDDKEKYKESIYPEAQDEIFGNLGKEYPTFVDAPSELKPGDSATIVSVFKNIKPTARKLSLLVRGTIQPEVLTVWEGAVEYEDFILRYDYDFPGPPYKPPSNLVFRSRDTIIERKKLDLSKLPSQQELQKIRQEIIRVHTEAMKAVQTLREFSVEEKPTEELEYKQPRWLVQTLRALARRGLSHTDFRVEFEESFEFNGRAIKSTGLVLYKAPGLSRVERVRPLGSGVSIKEILIYDGKTLSRFTKTKTGGPSLRHWKMSDIRPGWVTVKGYPELGLSELINPALCWLMLSPGVEDFEKLEGGDAIRLHIVGQWLDHSLLTSPVAPSFFSPLLSGKGDVVVDIETGLARTMLFESAGGKVRMMLTFKSPQISAGLTEKDITAQPSALPPSQP